MRIAIAAHSATRAGGVETYLSTVVPALAARGHAVACWFESAVADAEPVAPAAHHGPVWIDGGDAVDPLRPLREWSADVIYLHGLRSDLLERELISVAPVAFFAHSYYGACISGEKTTRFPVTAPCHRVFGPACLAHYLPRRCGGLSPLTMVQEYGAQRRKRGLLSAYDAVIVASEHMAREYRALGVGARVAPLPAAPPAAFARGRDRTGGEPWTLLYLGRLEPSKGVEIALESCAAAARALDARIRLVVAGQGSRAADLQREASRLGAGSPRLTVEFPGWLTDDTRADALRDADLLLVPSVWPEPFGMVGVEAAAAGVPAVAFDVGGIRDWLRDGVAGRLVPLDRIPVRRFADAIVRTLSDSAALGEMGRQARISAGRFTMAAHLDALEPILRELAARRADRVEAHRSA